MPKYKCCNHPGCSELTNDTYCEKHKRQKQVNYDANRPEYNRMYKNVRWRRERLLFLSENPLCVRCTKENKIVSATVVDHIKDHKGDYDLFWDKGNWQTLCAACHNNKTLNNR